MLRVFPRVSGLFQTGLRGSLAMAVAFSWVLGGCSDGDHFVVTAHRGASYVAPENTMAAMVAAVEAGAEFAELDVSLSRDGEVVLMHDRTLDRTTNGTGEVGEYSLEELRGLEAGGWFSQVFTGEPIPTLREVIRFAKGQLKLNIEIKNSQEEPTIAAAVVDIIRSEDFVKECMVTSFSRETVEEVKRIAPEITTGFNFGEDYPAHVFQGGWEVLSSN